MLEMISIQVRLVLYHLLARNDSSRIVLSKAPVWRRKRQLQLKREILLKVRHHQYAMITSVL